ncbi:MAG: helix-turn-helix domain-containing protein [Terracidiphilus sp.]|jgi:AraC-like DNA-binding protein
MEYLAQAPNPLLRSWVRTLWYCRAPRLPHRRERVLPNGCMQIILSLSRRHLTGCGEDEKADVRLPQAIVVGARTRYGLVDTGDMEELAGILFEPGGFAGLFRERADLFFERSIGLDDVWAGARIAERLSELPAPAEKLKALEAFLTHLFHRRGRRSHLVDQAIHLFRGRALSVAQCARSVGVSERRLSQVFWEQVGMGPKMWCRIRRFQAAVRALHKGVDVPWAELALRCGYYDQSHFANDFHAFSGINPTTYSARRGPWQNHVPLL